MGDLKKKTEIMLRAVLLSSPRGVPVYKLDREYKKITFQSIPFRELGYGSLDAYIKSIPQVASLASHNGETVVKGVASEADQHVAKLIAKQKKPKVRKNAPTRKPASSGYFPSFGMSQPKSSRLGPRFVAPRFQKQSQSLNLTTRKHPGLNITNLSSLKILVTQSVANGGFNTNRRKSPVPLMQSQTTYPTSDRKVEVVSAPLKGDTKISPDLTINVSGTTRTVSSGDVSSSNTKNKVAGLSPSAEAKVYANIKELLSKRPRGVWFQRFEVEYKQAFSEELPKSILESLTSLPHVARVEKPMPGRALLYPPRIEDVPPPKTELPQEVNIEVFTLRPQPLPEIHQSPKIVSVSHVDDVEHFFVQYKNLWDQIETLQESLQSIQGGALPALQTGMFCCAQFTEDDQWYRARVTELMEDKGTKTVQVIYVDFGNYEYLPLARLCMLRKEHAELPMGAVLCRLDDVKPLDGNKWTSETSDKFRELTNNEELEMTVVKIGKHHLHVQLCDKDNTSLASILVREGFAARNVEVPSTTASGSSPPSPSSTSSGSSTSASLESEMTRSQKSFRPRFIHKAPGNARGPGKVQIPDDQYLDLFVCNILATDNICVSIYGEDYSDKLTALEEGMGVYYADPPQDKAVQPSVGDIFASYSKDVHSEGQWYRVQVTEVKGDNVNIEFVDYGDTRVVPVSDLKPISPRFLELPFQAFSVALNGVPKTKNATVIENLKLHAQAKLLVGEVVKRTEDSVLVELYNTSTEADININSILRTLVIPDDMMKPVLPKVAEVIDVCVTYVSEEGEIFVQIPGAGISRLGELMEDITEHYSKATKAAEFMSSPRVGKICCAKCSEDGVWYRAVITQVLPDRQVEVQYVDYGNKECLPNSCLREPTKANEHVSSLPFQAVVCRLAGVSKESWNEDMAFKLMDLIEGQAATLEVVKEGDCPLVVLTVAKDDVDTAFNVVDLVFEGEQSSAVQQAQSLRQADDSSASDTEQQTVKQQAVHSSTPDILPVFSLSVEWIDITVTDVLDPGNFTFQPMKMLRTLEEITDKMAAYYTDHKVRMSDVKIGALCAALHPEHEQWYRVVIKAVLSPHQICVRFADYGDFGIVPSGNLRPLADEFRRQPLLGLQGRLSGLVPCSTAEWCDKAKKRLEELVVQKMLVARVMLDTSDSSTCSGDETRTPLLLYDTSNLQRDVQISDVLINEGLAKYADN